MNKFDRKTRFFYKNTSDLKYHHMPDRFYWFLTFNASYNIRDRIQVREG